MTEETTTENVETTSLLTDDEQTELELLQEEDTLDDEQVAKLAELKAKEAGTKATSVEEVEEEVETEAVVTEEEVVATEPETVEETKEVVEEEEIIEVEAEEVSENEKQLIPCGHPFKMFTVEEVQKERPTHNQIWGLYEAELENGLGCSTRCFAIDVSKQLKAGDELELPPTACTIRQSHRKQKDGDNSSKPATFDWLHI